MDVKLERIAVFAFLVLTCVGCAEAIREQAAIDHYVLGQLLADKGQYQAALEELALAVKNDPTLSAAYAASGDIYRRRGSHELARRSYEHACEANPYALRPHYNLGVTYQLLAEAASAFSQVQALLQKAVFIYIRAAELQPEDFDTHLNLSACYYQLGKYDLAEQYCKAATKVNPRSVEAWCNLGTIYDSQNRLYEAIRAYKNSLELNVHQPELLLNLASTYFRQGRMKAALGTYKLAAKEAPTNSAAWRHIGLCHYHLYMELPANDPQAAQQHMKESLEAYEKATQLDPRNAHAHRELGVVYMSQYVVDRSKTALRDKGLAAWHASLEIRPDQEDLRGLVEKYSPKIAKPQL
ncbi:MAG: tetratricopeptide repeat protein [Planctomycetota bacterium]|jgi:superkiller protein 3